MDRALVPVPGSHGVGPYTWDDFVALEDDDRRELIDGHLIEVDVPMKLHEYIVAKLIAKLDAWAESSEGGTVLASSYKVRITRARCDAGRPASERVPEYWLVDPDAGTLERYLLQKGRSFLYLHGNNETFARDTFPGLTISLARLREGPKSTKKRR
jgi:Uma2 family endonuclease